MAPRRVRLVRLALLVTLGVTVLLLALISLLRPAVATALIAVVTAVALFEAGAARWRRLSMDDDRPRRSLRVAGRTLAIATAAITTAISASLLSRNDDAGLPTTAPAPPQVTVPYEATARLTSSGWDVHEEIRVDDETLQGLQHHGGLSGTEVAELRNRLPLGQEWQLDRLVDGTPIYVRNTMVEVQERRLRITRAAFDVPHLPVLDVALIPRSTSSAILLAPRAAVAATTPPADDEVLTADEGGIARSVVPVDDSTEEVTVAVLGTWLRSPFGEKLYDLSTWPLLPYVVGAVALALAVWLRTWITARFTAVGRRPRNGRVSDGGPVSLDVARHVPRPRPPHVAGTRRRRNPDR
jgi:hypothetical protein